MTTQLDSIPIEATVLSPFYYHGLYAMDGSATHPDIITDTSILFALRSVFGLAPMLPRSTPNYQQDIMAMPWRSSLLTGEGNLTLPAIRHSIDVEREGGYSIKLQKDMASGYFKKTFFVHEVDVGAKYSGLLIGLNPFKYLHTKEIVLRIGVRRLGMLKIIPKKLVSPLHLNTATAKLFQRNISEQYRILDTIRVSQAYSLENATNELKQWFL